MTVNYPPFCAKIQHGKVFVGWLENNQKTRCVKKIDTIDTTNF